MKEKNNPFAVEQLKKKETAEQHAMWASLEESAKKCPSLHAALERLGK